VVREIYSRGLARGIFVEKPLASSFEEAKELCDLARIHGGINLVGYHKRFSLIFEQAAKAIRDDVLGEIIEFKGHAYSSDFVGAESSPNRSWSRGGVLRDLGCHVIDTALWILGDLQTVSKDPQSSNSTESAALEMEFELTIPSGVKGQFEVSSVKEEYRLPQIQLLVEGTKGQMSVDDDRLQLFGETSGSWHRHDFEDQAHFLLGDPEYSREDKYFINAFLSGIPGVPSFEDGAKVERIIDEIQGRAS
jgi:predicted dehydrogenase